MYSTHKLGGVLLGLALVVGGCNSQPMQQVQNRIDNVRSGWVARLRPSENNIDPVMVDPPADDAAQVRNWDQSTFVYPNGATLAYPTYGLNYEDRPKWLSNDYVYSLCAPGILFYDVLTMPVGMIMEPPATAVVYHGVRQPPTMTLAVPLQTPAQARYQQAEERRVKEAEPEPQPAPAQPEVKPQPEPQPAVPANEQPVKPEAAPAQPPQDK